ncbi:MAG: ATP-grasp domain-containing protein [Bacteriovorax sp.]|nr:ATP-grasp domain-containing protein [Bacteriovorax sp.]
MTSKKVLTIGIGQFQLLGIETLKKNGYTVIGIDGNQNAAGRALCDKFYHCELNENEKIIEIAKSEKVDFAIGFECDPAVEAINIVNEMLGLPALNETARRTNLDKLLVRKIQKELKLNMPLVYEIENLEQLKEIVQNSNHPWVLKPKASSGSRGVELIEQNSNIEAAFQRSNVFKKNTDPLMLEEFVPGKEIAIDGFAHNGECHILTISFKDRTAPPYLLDEGLLISNNIEDPLAIEAKRQLNAIFNSIQADLSSPFHAEFLYNENGVYLVEYSLRGAGFNVFSKLIPLVSGFDTLNFLINQSSGSVENWTFNSKSLNKNLYLGFFDGETGILKSIDLPSDLKNDPLVNECNIYVSAGDTTKKLKSGADRLGHIVLKGTASDSLREKFYAIKNKVKFIYE